MKTKITGTREWADKNVNIALGCSHNCRYCYAREMLVRLGKVTTEQWPRMKINNKAVDKEYKPEPVKPDGRKTIVMFPSSHDITPQIVSECLCVLNKLLDAGYLVLIVTKPHWSCITLICEALKNHRRNILFRFTIGSTSDDVLEFWEPGAPGFLERWACLQYAYSSGYQTSVSCEPYLDQMVYQTYQMCLPYITDSFWVGKLNKFDRRCLITDASKDELIKYVDPVRRQIEDEAVIGLYHVLKNLPLVRWKDSITKVLEKYKMKVCFK